MTGGLPPMDDAGACPECGCLPGDWERPADGSPSYAETLLRHCGCDCHPPEVRDRMRAFGARAYRPSPLDAEISGPEP
jgi:hypothetical protein